jgi:hypothetical protein
MPGLRLAFRHTLVHFSLTRTADPPSAPKVFSWGTQFNAVYAIYICMCVPRDGGVLVVASGGGVETPLLSES